MEPQTPGLETKSEEQRMGEWGTGAQGSRKGQTRPPWMGPRHRERSHVTESQAQALAVSRPHCEPSSG